MRALDVASSVAATLARAGAGAQVGKLGARPERTLQLYEFEACPYCRKVREALSVLDLDADVFPCPKRGPRFRAEVQRRGGKLQFPWLVDPNAGIEMYESDSIVRYLFERYGDGRVPLALALGRSPTRRHSWRACGGRASAPSTARRAHPRSRSSCGATRPRRSAASRAKRCARWSSRTACTTWRRAAPGAPSSCAARGG